MHFILKPLCVSAVLGMALPSGVALADAPETATFDALEAHLAENSAIISSGKFPDGTAMPEICEQFGYAVCASEAFLATRDDAPALTAAEVPASGRVLLDVRGAGEREMIPLGGAADHDITFGADEYDPRAIGVLDREDFAERVLATLDDPATPVALVCMAGVRSRAAAMALREAGFSDVVNVSDGVLGGASGPGMAADLGIELPAAQ